MKTMIYALFLAVFSFITLQAQELIYIEHSCSFDEDETNKEFYYFDSSSEADKIVQEIVDAVSLAKNFIVKSSDCKNALATQEGGKRYILYNTSFLENFKKDARTKWAAYCVLAHEIGHHLNGHDFKSTNSRLRKKMELQADIFAGGVLHKLGASLEEAKAGIELLQKKGESSTHPPARARAEAIANGWKKSKEQAERLKPLEKTPVSNTRELKKKEDPIELMPPEELFGENEKANTPPPKEDPIGTTVSDQLIFNQLLGTWQLDLGYNNYGQRVIVRSGLNTDGTMYEQTYINGVVTATLYYAWGVLDNLLTVVDTNGAVYYYTPSFNGNDVVVLTFLSTTGQAPYNIGTQLYYTRVY